MTAISTIAGALLVAVALRDVFETLFHPHGRGVISDRIVAGVWHLMRRPARRRRNLLSTAGPLSFMAVLLSWIALVVLGFALVFVPQMPENFTFAAEIGPEYRGGFLDAIYLSLVNLTSLGYGDIVPNTEALRILGPVETVIGLGLLTASISWLLSIYGVLADSRSLAREVALIAETEQATGITLVGTDDRHAAERLAKLTTRVVAVRRDLRHFPITYRFHARDPRSDLSLAVEQLMRMAREGSESSSPVVVFEGRNLELAIEDLLGTVAFEFVSEESPSPERTLELWRRDHLWDPS
jgi:hypothetical protein